MEMPQKVKVRDRCWEVRRMLISVKKWRILRLLLANPDSWGIIFPGFVLSTRRDASTLHSPHKTAARPWRTMVNLPQQVCLKSHLTIFPMPPVCSVVVVWCGVFAPHFFATGSSMLPWHFFATGSSMLPWQHLRTILSRAALRSRGGYVFLLVSISGACFVKQIFT